MQCEIQQQQLLYYDSGDRSSIVGISFVQIECLHRLVHECRAVFRRKAVSSARGHLFILDPQDLACHLQPSRNISLELTT